MSNPVAPVTEITLKGTTYKLVFDFEAIAEAEELTGQALLSGVFISTQAAQAPKINTVRAMFFAALHPLQPSITYADVKALVTHRNFIEVWSSTMLAWGEGMGQADPDEATEAAGEAQAQS